MFIRENSLAHRLTKVIMMTSTIVLVLTCGTFLTYELVTSRQRAANAFETRAKIIAATSTASLAFDDRQRAHEILSAVKVDPKVMAGALYGTNRTLFASYPTNLAASRFPAAPGPDGQRFVQGRLEIFEPVIQSGVRLGTLYLVGDLGAIQEGLRLYGGIVILVLLSSLGVAYILSRGMQRSISDPIVALVNASRSVSELKDYSVRAPRLGNDELGTLTDAFNHMLMQIHDRDTALRENAERLQLALEASRTGTWDYNLQTGRITWDPFLYRLFGLRPGEFHGTCEHFLSLIHPDDQSDVSRVMRMATDQRIEFIVEFRVVWADGSMHCMASRGKAFYDEDGRSLRMTGVTMDVTQSREAEEARRRSEEEIRRLNMELEERVRRRTAQLAETNQELEEFTYSVSHDLRAPLRHIDGYAQVLQDDFSGQLPEQAMDYLRRIRRGTQNMGHLVDDLLHFARLGRQELNRRATALRPLVMEVLADLRPEVDSRQVEFVVAELPVVKCDSGLIRQVFANLLANAIKYTRPRPHAVVEVGWDPSTGDIFVRDNGVGFNMKYANKLFGVFQRLHRLEEFEGTGVGLAMVDRIIRKHGGRVWAEAELDKGATFHFTLGAVEFKGE